MFGLNRWLFPGQNLDFTLVAAEFNLRAFRMDTVCYGNSRACTEMEQYYGKDYWDNHYPGKWEEIQDTLGVYIHVGQNDFQDSLARTENYIVSVIMGENPTSGHFDLSKLPDRTVISFQGTNYLNSKMLDDEVERQMLKVFLNQVRTVKMLRKQAEMRQITERSSLIKMFQSLAHSPQAHPSSKTVRNVRRHTRHARPMSGPVWDLPLTCTSDCYNKVDYLMIGSCRISGSNVRVPAVYVDSLINIQDPQIFEESDNFFTYEPQQTSDISRFRCKNLSLIFVNIDRVLLSQIDWTIFDFSRPQNPLWHEWINITVKQEQVRGNFSVMIESDVNVFPIHEVAVDALYGTVIPYSPLGFNISIQGNRTILKDFIWSSESWPPAVPGNLTLNFQSDWDTFIVGQSVIVVESDSGSVNIVNQPRNAAIKQTLIRDRVVGGGRQDKPTAGTEYPDGSTEGGNSTVGPEDGGTGGGDGDPDNKTGIIVGVVIAVIAVIAIVVVVVVCVVRKRKARVFGDIDVNGDDHQETQNEENNDEPCDTHESGHCEDGGASCDPGERGGECGDGEGEGEGGQNDPEAPRAPEGDGDGPE